jgi:glycosyltransferase involved in cell wall biosynthesis
MMGVFSKKFTIGFPRVSKAEGPKIFLSRLVRALEQQDLARAVPSLLPWYDVALFSSYARFCYGRPFFLRLDGIAFDLQETCGSNEAINGPIFDGIERAKGVIYQSMFNKRLIETSRGATKEPYTVIPNGVDLHEFTPAGENFRSRLNIPDNVVVLVTSAAWRAHKRLQDVIDIFVSLDKDSPGKFHLLILGQPPESILSHPRLHCPGFIPPQQLPKWYRSADLFIFLSWLDSCPNSVIEALCCGVPVICTNQGGTREIVERADGGIVVEADEEFSFAQVDLYHPPRPDHGKILQAIDEMMVHVARYRRGINREALDIGNIALQYVEFMRECME